MNYKYNNCQNQQKYISDQDGKIAFKITLDSAFGENLTRGFEYFLTPCILAISEDGLEILCLQTTYYYTISNPNALQAETVVEKIIDDALTLFHSDYMNLIENSKLAHFQPSFELDYDSIAVKFHDYIKIMNN
jgi:hypothetical protein